MKIQLFGNSEQLRQTGKTTLHYNPERSKSWKIECLKQAIIIL